MRAIAILAVLTLSGCLTPCPAPATGAATSSFECGDGSGLAVTFSQAPDAARVAQDGYTTLILPARLTASGYRYAEGGAELRGRGAEVRWTRPGAAETICQRR